MSLFLQLAITFFVSLAFILLLSYYSYRLLPLIKREEIYKGALEVSWQYYSAHMQYIVYLNMIQAAAGDVEKFRAMLHAATLEFVARDPNDVKKAIADLQMKNIRTVIDNIQKYMANLLTVGEKALQNLPSNDSQAKLFALAFMYLPDDVMAKYRSRYIPTLDEVGTCFTEINHEIVMNGTESKILPTLIDKYSKKIEIFYNVIIEELVPLAKEATERSWAIKMAVWLADRLSKLFEKSI